MSGASNEPRTPLELDLNDAIDLFTERVQDRGGTVEQGYFFAWCEGVGKPDAVSAGVGFEDATDLLAFLVGQAQSLAKALGMRMELITIDKPIGQG